MRDRIRSAAAVLALAAAAAAVVAGCGGGDEVAENDPAAPLASEGGPAAAGREATAIAAARPAPVRVSASVAQQLSGGAVAVAGVDRRAEIAPDELHVNREQTFSGLRWEGWGSPGARARGRVTTLVCDPSCAGGKIERTSGTVVLGQIVSCRGRRFYSRARLVVRSDAAQQPDAFLSAPCRESA
jgi:hypothetical protein